MSIYEIFWTNLYCTCADETAISEAPEKVLSSDIATRFRNPDFLKKRAIIWQSGDVCGCYFRLVDFKFGENYSSAKRRMWHFSRSSSQINRKRKYGGFSNCNVKIMVIIVEFIGWCIEDLGPEPLATSSCNALRVSSVLAILFYLHCTCRHPTVTAHATCRPLFLVHSFSSSTFPPKFAPSPTP